MEKGIRESISNLRSADDKARFKALQAVLKATESKVDWIYDVWDDLRGMLSEYAHPEESRAQRKELKKIVDYVRQRLAVKE